MFFSALLVAGMFILLRKIERWLHQHLFKVGWLLTKDFKTTTILYYTFFLPGVFLNQFVYWLAAGVMNVRADRAIKWPDPQEIGELRLNFVQISPRAGVYRRAIIAAAPLIVGLTCVWLIASNSFHIPDVMQTMSSGELPDIAAGIQQLMGAPDFWLWFYILFTIANTMYPSVPAYLQGWRTVAGALVILVLTLFIIGVGGDIFGAVAVPISQFLNTLQGILLLVISMNVFVTIVLGTIEAIIERITGNSATFRRGKMIVMTRAEALEAQRREQERQRKQQAASRRNPAADSGLPSVYRLLLPVPGAPGEEPITQFGTILPDVAEKPAPTLQTGRTGADLIPGETQKPALPAAVPSEPLIRTPTDFRKTPLTPESSAESVPANEIPESSSPSAEPAPSEEQDSGAIPDSTRSPIFPVSPILSGKPDSPFGSPSSPVSAERPEDRETETVVEAEDVRSEAPGMAVRPAPAFTASQVEDNKDEQVEADEGNEAEHEKRVPANPAVSPVFVRPASPFSRPAPAFSPPDDEDEGDEDEDEQPTMKPVITPAASQSPFARPVSPFAAPVATTDEEDEEYEDDDDDSDDDELLSRRSTVPDATDSLFDRLNEDDEKPFGTGKPAASSPFSRPASPFQNPFSASRPAPGASGFKSTAGASRPPNKADDDIDDLRQELTYEPDEDYDAYGDDDDQYQKLDDE